jgi:hypothetical protein
MFARHVAVCAAEKTRQGAGFHPIWYGSVPMVPYIAVNEFEQTPSRRFGRDLFQTRSTR